MHYQNVDLNLFSLFEALMRTRSVTAAARELGVTPSATSHGLARLRRLLGDELFLSSPKGMRPTSRATVLAPKVAAALSQLEEVLGARLFQPGTEDRLFTISATDYTMGLIGPHLARRLRDRAPAIQLRVVPQGRLDVVQLLDEGRIDLVLGWFGALPERINRQTLITEHEAVVVRQGHPLTRGPLTRERLLEHAHLVVELTGSEQDGEGGFMVDRGVLRRTWIERFLMEAGQATRRSHVAMTVSSYASVAPILRMTNLVGALPRRLAEQAARYGGLAILRLPYQPLAVSVEMIWHNRAVSDAGLRWLTAQVEAAAQDLQHEEHVEPAPDPGRETGPQT